MEKYTKFANQIICKCGLWNNLGFKLCVCYDLSQRFRQKRNLI